MLSLKELTKLSFLKLSLSLPKVSHVKYEGLKQNESYHIRPQDKVDGNPELELGANS